MIEHRLLEFSTNMDEETLKVSLLPGSVQIWIEVYDGDSDAFVSRPAEVTDPDDIEQLGRILSSHAESIRSGAQPASPIRGGNADLADLADPAPDGSDAVAETNRRTQERVVALSGLSASMILPLAKLVTACHRRGLLQADLYSKTRRPSDGDRKSLERSIWDQDLAIDGALSVIASSHPEMMRSLAVLREVLALRTCQGCDGVVASQDHLDCTMHCDACRAKRGLPPITT